MSLIAISMGHSGAPDDMGAYNRTHHIWEHNVVRELAYDVAAELAIKKYPTCLIEAGHLGSKIDEINSINAMFVVEIHLNAFEGGMASGTECLCWYSSRMGKALAIWLQESIVKKLGTRNRGIVLIESTKQRGGLFLGKTNCPAVITESLFINNDDDCELFLSPGTRARIVDAHVRGIEGFYGVICEQQ